MTTNLMILTKLKHCYITEIMLAGYQDTLLQIEQLKDKRDTEKKYRLHTMLDSFMKSDQKSLATGDWHN
jgi:hypothetical protein